METETAPVRETQEVAPEATETPQEAPAETQETPTAFDPNTLPKEAVDHFSKQYEGHDNYKKMADEYGQLLRNQEFQDWYRGKTQPKTPDPEAKKFELSDDEFVAALADKGKFTNLVTELAKKIASEQLGPQIANTQREVAYAKQVSALDQVMKKFPDFRELDKKGLIEPILARYNGQISFEDAYWIAKKDTFNEEVDRRARGLVEKKKAGSIEKPGGPSNQRGSKVTAKTSLEAMEIAAAAFREGREIPDIEFE